VSETKKITYSGLFLALAVLIPYIFHISGIPGNVFLPMHIPVILCGFICGKKYGLIIGLISPLINTALVGMPVLYPIGISMVFELAAYGFFAGYLYKLFNKKIILTLLSSMVIGRIIKGIVMYLITVPFGNIFVLKGFLTVIFITSIWGILIQIILIPIVIKIYNKLS